MRHSQSPGHSPCLTALPEALLILTFIVLPRIAHAQARSPSTDAIEPVNLQDCVRYALEANPSLQSRQVALEASRANLTIARSSYYPSLAFTGSASRLENGDTGTINRHDLGLSIRQTLYRGGRVDAGVDAAASAMAIDEAALAVAGADLVLAVRLAWYRLAQADQLVLSSEQALERSRLNLEYAEAQIRAGLTTRPDVLRARVDVSAVEVELTRSRNSREEIRALLNTLMGRSPSAPLNLVPDSFEDLLPLLPDWEELRQAALEARDEQQLARARTKRQEAVVRLARGVFLPSVSADVGLNRGSTASLSPRESWSVGLLVALPLFEGFAPTAQVQAQKALLEASRFDEETAAQQIEREVWDALLAEAESARRLENARALLDAAQENLDAVQESYQLGLGSMIALVDARTAFTYAEQTLIQAVYDRHIARAVLDRATGTDFSGEERP